VVSKEIFVLLAFTVGLAGGLPLQGYSPQAPEVVREDELRVWSHGRDPDRTKRWFAPGPLAFGSIVQFLVAGRCAFWALVPVTALVLQPAAWPE